MKSLGAFLLVFSLALGITYSASAGTDCKADITRVDSGSATFNVSLDPSLDCCPWIGLDFYNRDQSDSHDLEVKVNWCFGGDTTYGPVTVAADDTWGPLQLGGCDCTGRLTADECWVIEVFVDGSMTAESEWDVCCVDEDCP